MTLTLTPKFRFQVPENMRLPAIGDAVLRPLVRLSLGGAALRVDVIGDQLGMDVTRPGPAPQVRNALVINGDNCNAVRWLARSAGAGKVVEATLQTTDEIGRGVKDQGRDDNRNAGEPIGLPKGARFR